jgi:hypothetical protein
MHTGATGAVRGPVDTHQNTGNAMYTYQVLCKHILAMLSGQPVYG